MLEERRRFDLQAIEDLLGQSDEFELATLTDEEIALVDPWAPDERLSDRDLAALAAAFRSLEARKLLTPGRGSEDPNAHGPLATVLAFWGASQRTALIEIGADPPREIRRLYMLAEGDIVMQDTAERGLHAFTLRRLRPLIAELTDLILENAPSGVSDRQEFRARIVGDEKSSSAGSIDDLLRDSTELTLIDVAKRLDETNVARIVVTLAIRTDGVWLVGPIPDEGRPTLVARPVAREDTVTALGELLELRLA